MKKLSIQSGSKVEPEFIPTIQNCIEAIHKLALANGSQSLVLLCYDSNAVIHVTGETYNNNLYTVGYRAILYMIDEHNKDLAWNFYTKSSHWFAIQVNDVEKFYKFLTEE